MESSAESPGGAGTAGSDDAPDSVPPPTPDTAQYVERSPDMRFGRVRHPSPRGRGGPGPRRLGGRPPSPQCLSAFQC